MKQSTWKILSFIAAIAMALVTIVAAVMGGCTTMIECTGGYMPMKCHWTFIAVGYLGIAGAVAALFGAAQGQAAGRRMAAVAVLLFALVAILVISPAGIGTCAHADSHCNTTAAVEYVLNALAIVLAIVMLARADAERAAKPKQRL